MIPADLASRLKVLIDSELKPVIPVQEVLSDLPELEQGQRFSAQIQAPLPDGNFRAIVAGRTVTLAMPSGAKAGDVLDLVVTGSENKTVNARLADPGQQAQPSQAQISPAGRLISQVLTGRYGDTAPVSLNGNEPLLPAAPAKAAALTPALRQAISESGLFYEAHQAQWIGGETSLESLLREPQARNGQTPPATQSGLQAADAQLPPHGTADANAQNPARPANPAGHSAELELPPGTPPNRDRSDVLIADKTALQGGQQSAQLRIAEQLMPLVHQQLETLATHQAIWQGQVWPGQSMEWRIFDPEGEHSSSEGQADGAEPPPWQSTLRLRMPRLGGIEAQLIITASGVAVRVIADSVQAAEQLQQGSEALGNALDAAGVPLTGFAVQLEKRREARG